MTNKLSGPRFRGGSKLTSELFNILSSGRDLLGFFPGRLSEKELCEAWRECWEPHAEEVAARYQDRTTKAMSWWWFSAPPGLRIPFGEILSKTQQRKILLEHGLLTGGTPSKRNVLRRLLPSGQVERSISYRQKVGIEFEKLFRGER